MEKVEIYLKAEPAGEYAFGEITKEELIEEGFNFDNYEFEDEDDFILNCIEYNNITAEYGCVLGADKDDLGLMFKNIDHDSIDWEKMNVVISDDESIKKLKSSPGKFFVQYTAPSKYSMDFDLNVDINDFKPELVKIVLKRINFPYADSYGAIKDFYVINSFSYAGEDYDADMYDSLIDRGYDREIVLIETDAEADEIDGEIYNDVIFSTIEMYQ